MKNCLIVCFVLESIFVFALFAYFSYYFLYRVLEVKIEIWKKEFVCWVGL
jgi:hypothetical protein